MVDEPGPLLFVHFSLPWRVVCMACHRARTHEPIGRPADGSQCWECGQTLDQIAETQRGDQRRAKASREELKAGLRALARNHLKPQITELLKLPFDPSLLPPDHLPTCPANPPDPPVDGKMRACNCTAERLDKHPEWERSSFHRMLRDSNVKPVLLAKWREIEDKRQKNRKSANAFRHAVMQVLEKIFQVYYSGLDDLALALSLDKGIGHHTTRPLKEETALQKGVDELLGIEPIQVEPRDHLTNEPKGIVTNSTSLGFLCWAWQHACDVGFLPELAPWHNVYRPVGGSRRAKKASLILRILEELGRHTTSKRRGWVQVPLTELCDAVGIPRNNPRYTEAGKLLDELAKLGVVWASHAPRNRSYRLCAYVRPDNVLAQRESPKSTTRTIQKRK